MPQQVGKAGGGPGPVVTNAGDGVKDVKAAEVETKSAEQQKDVAKNEAAVPHKATAKEASNKKAELSAGAAAQQAALNSKLNVIHGTSGNDNIHISKAPGLPGLLGLYEIDVNDSKQYMTKQQLEHSEFRTGAGNDTVVVDSDVKADITVDGGSGNDVIIGGGGDDHLIGGKGKDTIDGGDGNDYISGGDGHDNIKGGRGNDVILGGKGFDLIEGGTGFDVILSGDGKDITDQAKKK